jgi:hypothetical protein
MSSKLKLGATVVVLLGFAGLLGVQQMKIMHLMAENADLRSQLAQMSPLQDSNEALADLLHLDFVTRCAWASVLASRDPGIAQKREPSSSCHQCSCLLPHSIFVSSIFLSSLLTEATVRTQSSVGTARRAVRAMCLVAGRKIVRASHNNQRCDRVLRRDCRTIRSRLARVQGGFYASVTCASRPQPSFAADFGGRNQAAPKRSDFHHGPRHRLRGGPSHDFLLEETPVENILAMFDAVQEFGVYQIGR